MAMYKNSAAVRFSNSTAFDDLYKPGSQAPRPGIYRCIACGDEIGIAKGHTLPPQNHAQHSVYARIEWQLLVLAEQKY